MSVSPAALGRIHPTVEHRLTQVLEDCHRRREDLGQAAPELFGAAGNVLSGGKRMRTVSGTVGCAILDTLERRSEHLAASDAVHLGVALGLYQANVLIHDDLIGSADTRHGLSATRRAFARDHEDRSWLGRPQTLGANGAILLDDPLLSLAGKKVSTLALSRTSSQARGSAVRHAWSAFSAMTAEVALGQFLDVHNENLLLPWGRELSTAAGLMQGDALSVIWHKSARYSVRHPLLTGTLLASLNPDGAIAEHLVAFGKDVGIAFQLRGDELGVFGSPRATGKPAGNNLCEDKRTVLLALTWGWCDDADRRLPGSALANPEAMEEQISEVATLIEDCGARVVHEEIIAMYREAGSRTLECLRDEGVVSTASLEDLTVLADLLMHRAS